MPPSRQQACSFAKVVGLLAHFFGERKGASTFRKLIWNASMRCHMASQRSLHYAPIFRLLLKVAVNGTHQCDFLNFCGASVPTIMYVTTSSHVCYNIPSHVCHYILSLYVVVSRPVSTTGGWSRYRSRLSVSRRNTFHVCYNTPKCTFPCHINTPPQKRHEDFRRENAFSTPPSEINLPG